MSQGGASKKDLPGFKTGGGFLNNYKRDFSDMRLGRSFASGSKPSLRSNLTKSTYSKPTHTKYLPKSFSRNSMNSSSQYSSFLKFDTFSSPGKLGKSKSRLPVNATNK